MRWPAILNGVWEVAYAHIGTPATSSEEGLTGKAMLPDDYLYIGWEGLALAMDAK